MQNPSISTRHSRYRVRYDDAQQASYDSFDEAARVALREAPDGAQLHIETVDSELHRHWIFDRDAAAWVEQAR